MIGLSIRSANSQQVSPESLLVRLRSPDWAVRSEALARLSVTPRSSLPPGYADAIVELLDQEAASPDTSAFGEGYGEYLIQVVAAATSLGDPRTLRGMAIWGIQAGRAARAFVAGQGSAALPYLDEAWASRHGSRHSITDTWALMLGQHADRLQDGDRTTVLAKILRADSIDFVDAVTTAPFPETLPLVEGIGAATGERILRVAAAETAAELRPLRAALTPGALTQRTSSMLSALCLAAEGLRSSVCASLAGSLSRASAELAANQNGPGRDTLATFATRVDSAFHQGLFTDAQHRLLSANARYVGFRLSSAIYLEGRGATANPSTLALAIVARTATIAKYQDSPAITFSGGNPWVAVGTWTSPPGLGSGTLSALGAAQVWLGLKNSDDIGTNFDLRVEAYKNGTLVAAGQTLCIQGITRNADLAKAVTVAFPPLTATTFDGVADVLSIKVLTRIGTTTAGAACGGHVNAVGLRLYFDAVSRNAQFAATF
jgi:hypothetical protein